MGEIGIPRHEFLYEIRYWEARRIVRGYRMRNALHYQLMRMNIWASMFCMGNPKNVKPKDLFKLYFEKEAGWDAPPLTDEERMKMQEEMRQWNAHIHEGSEG